MKQSIQKLKFLTSVEDHIHAIKTVLSMNYLLHSVRHPILQDDKIHWSVAW